MSEKPAWMAKDFRYAPSSPEAVAARERCVPGPDWVPNLQADNRKLRADLEQITRERDEAVGLLRDIKATPGSTMDLRLADRIDDILAASKTATTKRDSGSPL